MMPTNVGLRRDTGRLARYVGAQNFPQPNMMLFISKYILELNLPSKFKIILKSVNTEVSGCIGEVFNTNNSSYPALAPAP